MADRDFPHRIEAVRRFSRFYTERVGALREGLLESPFPLTQARIIYELAHRGETTATELGSALGLDGGYLSRILRGFRKTGLVAGRPAADDGRRSILSLTDRGRAAFATLDSRSRNQIAAWLSGLSAADQRRLVAAMGTVERLLGAPPERKAPYLLRQPEPGDMGWVVSRHGALYAEEYGFDEKFEALVAGIAADFLETCDPKKERCWIAEVDGEPAGSVLLVQRSETVCKLRLLLVEPKARGLGIGARLVDECIRFARRAGYRRMTLWTNSILDAARHIYETKGFSPVAEEAHRSFGRDLVGETWELDLTGPAR